MLWLYMYALPVYFGYLTEGQRHMLQQVLHRASSRGFTPYYYDLDTLVWENAITMQLRTCGHQFELPAIKYEFNKQNFIVRSLFNYV